MEDIIILVDENGEEQEYELLDTVEYEGERYVVLIQDDDDEVSILKEVYNIFKENNTDNFDFED